MRIRLEHVTKVFPSRDKNKKDDVTAVDDFLFEIPDGKLVGLLGPSGCGKSTALNLICGLESPTTGKIYFDDEDVTKKEPQGRGVGMVFQSYALYPHLTVMKNILFPLENLKGDKKLTKEEMRKKAQDVASIVEIDGLLNRKPKEMSGGQQQRVAIARALVKSPKVLLLDEPLSNLDARLRIQTREQIKRIQEETKITTVFVTHDQEEAMSISDIIIVMRDGRVNQIGKPQDVYDDPVNLFVAKFLGNPPINVMEGKIMDGGLYILDQRVMEVNSTLNKEVIIGIRPEGFIINPEGKLRCDLKALEVMGRDTIVSFMINGQGEKHRAIISSSEAKGVSGELLVFELIPDKVLIFDKETEERIRV